jgi:hypothetical protein
MNIYSNFAISGALFLGMTLFGIWLGMAGKPYNTAIFTVHKLLALAFVVLTIIKLIPYIKEAPINGLLLFLLIVTVLSLIGLFASGAAMSIIKESKPLLLWLHRILPASTLAALFGILELIKTNY